MTKPNYSLRLQPWLKAAAEQIAKDQGTTLNQFINVAVAEKLSALHTADYFLKRSKKADTKAALAILKKIPANQPRDGDYK